jgi:xanthine dehydrogenase FAD-binding subunit
MRQVFLPQTLEALWEILEREPEAAVYAGGTDLLVKIRSGQVKAPSLVCLERIEALRGVRDHGEEVYIGAATTHSHLLEDTLIRKHFPILIQGLGVLASPPIRHMGTIGGNIVTASPAGDTLPPLYVLAASLEVRGSTRARRVSLNDFILGPGTVDLRAGEILAGIWLKKSPRWSVYHYEKVGRRKAQACAVASMAALVEVSPAGRIEAARLAWGSVGPTVVTSAEVEKRLTGEALSSMTLRTALHLVEDAVSPIDDVRASAQYRRMVASALLMRLTEYSK